MERKRKLQWIYAIASVVAMGVTRDLVEKYGEDIRVNMAIIGLVVLAVISIFMLIVCKKSERKQVSLMIILFMLVALMVFAMYLDNMILLIASIIIILVASFVLAKIVENMNK